jgi:hypothetical protein
LQEARRSRGEVERNDERSKQMKQLKRSECAILPLVLKGKWYDMIASVKKKEEYRDFKPYWVYRLMRFCDKRGDKACIVSFSKGYKKADMFFEIRTIFRDDESNHPEWGEPETPHYVIKLGERVELVD